MTQRRIYQEEFPYFITWRTREGFALFEKREYAELLARIIFNAGEIKGYDILAYQIMPDHVHALVWNNLVHIGLASAGRDTRAREKSISSPPPARVSAPALGHFLGNNDGSSPVTISEFMYMVKSYFVYQIRRQYGIGFPFFQKRFYTRIITTDKYLKTVIEYVRHNPVKARLPIQYRRMPYQYFDSENTRLNIGL